jgi:hypothetical protein
MPKTLPYICNTWFRKTWNVFIVLLTSCTWIACHTHVMKPKYLNNMLMAAIVRTGPAATTQHCLAASSASTYSARGTSRHRRGSTTVCMHSGSPLSNRRTHLSQGSVEEPPAHMIGRQLTTEQTPWKSHRWSRNSSSSDLTRRKIKWLFTSSSYWSLPSAS